MATSLAFGSEPDGLAQLQPADSGETDELIKRIFADYRNHYSTNPLLSRINVVAAYQDWTRKALRSSSSAVFKAATSNGAAAGLCVTEAEDESFAEILLAGIVPEERGHGAYQAMLRFIGHEAQSAGKDSVVISTQSANIGVMRVWCRLGFLPTFALNTFHVVRRDTYQASIGDPVART